MLFIEGQRIDDGGEMLLTDGVGRVTNKVVTKLAGPFRDGNKYVMVVRYDNGHVTLHNITDLVEKPPTPVEGDTWFHRVDGPSRSRYVAGVTSRHVVLKSDQGRPDNKAHVMALDEFVKAFQKKR